MPSLGGVTVLDVCEALGLRLLAGCEAAGRVVTAVHVIELSEPWDHLAPGELVLSNGLWHDSVGTVEAYVEKLVRHQAAGMGYGLVEPGTQVPDDVIAACESAGLALFEVPPEGRFVDISAYVFESTQGRQSDGLKQSLERTHRMAAALASEGGLESMLDVLGELLGRTVVLGTTGGSVRYAAGPQARTIAALDDPRGWEARPVGSGLGLMVRRSPVGSPPDDRETLDQASALIQVEMRRLRDNAAFRRRYLTELLRMIESDAEQAVVVARCSALGLRLDRGVRFVVASVAQGGTVELPDLPTGGSLARADDDVTALLPADDVDALVAALTGLGAVTAVGIGEAVTDTAGLRRGLLEARRATRLARRLGEGSPPVLRHREMRHHRVLLDALDDDAALAFRDAVLGLLLEYDDARDAELVTTLETYLNSSVRWAETAQELNIHQNTLRYRLARVEALTGTRLSDIADRVDFYLALAIHRDRR